MLVYQAMRTTFLICNKIALSLAFVCLVCASADAAINVDIRGVDEEIANNIRLHLSSWESLPGTTAKEVEDAVDRDVERALQALGYYHSQTTYSIKEQTLVLEVNPGEPILWNSANITLEGNGATAPEFIELRNNNPFIRGERLKHQDYENFKRRLLNKANELGYLDAQLQKSQLRIDTEKNSADVELTLQTGQRYRLGKITVNNSEVSQRVVNLLIEVQEGEWFSANLIGNIYNHLLESGYFTSVNIAMDKQPPDLANLTIDVVDSPEHKVSTGVGYGTDTGPRFQLKWQRPHTNARGNSWNSQLQISGIEQSVTTRYRIPYYHPQKRYFSWDNGYQRKQVEDALTQKLTTGLLFHLLRDNDWQYSVGVNLDHDRSRIDNEPEDIQTYVIPSARASKRGILGDFDDPRFAYKFWLNLAQSTTYLGSDTDFSKINVGFITITSLGQNHKLVARLDAGAIYTASSGDFNDVPLSQKFLTGGDQSIRGYDYDTVSPVDADGDPLGGQYFTAGSLEYRYQWAKNWQAALFYDRGRSYITDLDSCTACIDTGEEYRTSYGVGVRWLSPVGYIALDFAFPQTPAPNKTEPDNWKFHFYLSTAL